MVGNFTAFTVALTMMAFVLGIAVTLFSFEFLTGRHDRPLQPATRRNGWNRLPENAFTDRV